MTQREAVKSGSPPESQNLMAPAWPTWDGTSLLSSGCCHQNTKMPFALPLALSFSPKFLSPVLTICPTGNFGDQKPMWPCSGAGSFFRLGCCPPVLLISALVIVCVNQCIAYSLEYTESKSQNNHLTCLVPHNYASWGWWATLWLCYSRLRKKTLCSTTFQTWDPSEVLDTSLNFPLQALFQKGVLTLFYCKGVFSSLKPFYGNFAAM